MHAAGGGDADTIHVSPGIGCSYPVPHINHGGRTRSGGLRGIFNPCIYTLAVRGKASVPFSPTAVLIRGGNANNGANDGAFFGNWGNAASNSNWNYAARPPLS